MSEWVVIAIIAVAVIFGASKLPQFARNVGKAQGEFKKGLKEGATDDDETAPAPPAAAAPPPQQAATPPPASVPQPAPETAPPPAGPADPPATQA
ncbi:MAG TPA: twin-arginine translocase TatA/TatE family subunit [Actinomycetota bacterium]|jgi:sec-independent protein translocase protein TatA